METRDMNYPSNRGYSQRYLETNLDSDVELPEDQPAEEQSLDYYTTADQYDEFAEPDNYQSYNVQAISDEGDVNPIRDTRGENVRQDMVYSAGAGGLGLQYGDDADGVMNYGGAGGGEQEHFPTKRYQEYERVSSISQSEGEPSRQYADR